MKALPKLKNSKLNVRVTHDYTIMDRKKITLCNLKAKAKKQGGDWSICVACDRIPDNNITIDKI